MRARVVLRRAAELDLAAIDDWYEAQDAGLGGEFLNAVDKLLGHISENPHGYPERYRGARRAILRRFPYIVWYRVVGDTVAVLAASMVREIPGCCVHVFEGAPNPRTNESFAEIRRRDSSEVRFAFPAALGRS